MKKNLGKKNWMFPMPVLMIGTYGEDGTPDVMNADLLRHLLAHLSPHG